MSDDEAIFELRTAKLAISRGIDVISIQRSELTKLRADKAALLAAAERLFELEPSWRDDQDAPGHAHRVKGVWDKTNGPPTGGQSCEWCQAWFAFLEAIKQAQAETP